MKTQTAATREDHDGSQARNHEWAWYGNGNAFFTAVLDAVGQARLSVRLETYIFAAQGIGVQLREALAAAATRGVSVQVLVDGFGSRSVPASFWQPIHGAGGQVRVFNPLRPRRWGIRDHRKLLVCDNTTAFIGGFNIAPEYEGDGVTQGWRDVALRVTGPLASALGTTFDRMFASAAFQHKAFARLRRSEEKRVVRECGCEIILSGPGRGASPLARALRRDLAHARSVRIMAAYFLPSRRLRGSLARAARRGATVEILVPSRSDVPLSKLATESLYRRLLKAGVKIFEYEPQMLHGKLFLVDDTVYVGSSNLDPRSLRLNYEVMVRIHPPHTTARTAQSLFSDCLLSCRRVTRADWRKQGSLWTRMKQRFAHFVMTRLDPWITLSQWPPDERPGYELQGHPERDLRETGHDRHQTDGRLRRCPIVDPHCRAGTGERRMRRGRRVNTRPLRTIALFEAGKGLLVLVAGTGVLSFTNERIRTSFEELVRHTHLNPSKHMPHSIVDAIADPSKSTLLTLAAAAGLYAVIRFVEACGLWHARRWAAWFGLLSGLVYVPFEVLEFATKPGALSLTLLLINLAVVLALYKNGLVRKTTPETSP